MLNYLIYNVVRAVASPVMSSPFSKLAISYIVYITLNYSNSSEVAKTGDYMLMVNKIVRRTSILTGRVTVATRKNKYTPPS